MIHKKIRIPKQSSIEIMDKLGRLDNAIEFIDLNKDNFEAKKSFQYLLKRLEDVENKIK